MKQTDDEFEFKEPPYLPPLPKPEFCQCVTWTSSFQGSCVVCGKWKAY